MMDIQSYLTVADNISPPEQSNVIYYKVLHQRCDDKETLLNVINENLLPQEKEILFSWKVTKPLMKGYRALKESIFKIFHG